MATAKPININKVIGLKLKKARQHRGYSQTDFANKVNYTQASLSYMESGKKRISIENIVQFSKVLNVNPLYFLGDLAKFTK